MKKILGILLVGLMLSGCQLVDFALYAIDRFGESTINVPEKPPDPPPVVIPPPVTPPPVIPPPVVPPPITSNLALFDLGPCETCTWREMQKAGFPCREGVCLYALGQVARGYPIPVQSEELAAIDQHYDRIRVWYEGKVSEGKARLVADPGLSLTICTNDAVDRFGCRLCPPTLELFQSFGDRVTLGDITPESSY